jgi:hypothetical protein
MKISIEVRNKEDDSTDLSINEVDTNDKMTWIVLGAIINELTNKWYVVLIPLGILLFLILI